MGNDIEEEVALALAIALSSKDGNERRQAQPAHHRHKCAWRRGLESKPHVSWTRAHGWKNTARHEALRGR